MSDNKIPRCVKGRDGWRFVLRDPGQTVRLKDYEKVNLSRATRGSGPHYEGVTRYKKDEFIEKKSKALTDALSEFKAGRFIYGDVFIRLCNHHKITLTQGVFYKCLYMNELDISIKVIRHKNTRGDYGRPKFDGLFDAIQQLLAETL